MVCLLIQWKQIHLVIIQSKSTHLWWRLFAKYNILYRAYEILSYKDPCDELCPWFLAAACCPFSLGPLEKTCWRAASPPPQMWWLQSSTFRQQLSQERAEHAPRRPRCHHPPRSLCFTLPPGDFLVVMGGNQSHADRAAQQNSRADQVKQPYHRAGDKNVTKLKHSKLFKCGQVVGKKSSNYVIIFQNFSQWWKTKLMYSEK